MNLQTYVILVLAFFIAVALLLEARRQKVPRCPLCSLRYSDWFLWDNERYCYPCWAKDHIVRKEGASVAQWYESDFPMKTPMDRHDRQD